MNLDKVMMDYMSCTDCFINGVPGVVLLDRQGTLKVVGEMKVWRIHNYVT